MDREVWSYASDKHLCPIGPMAPACRTSHIMMERMATSLRKSSEMLWFISAPDNPQKEFKRLEDAFAGAAKKAGLSTEEKTEYYMKDIRREARGY